MTVVRRRSQPKPSGRRAPISERFKRGTPVQVYDDCQHENFAGRLGEVVSVCEDTDDIYPRGRVEVRLKIDELYERLYFPDRPPKTVWFKPNDLERL